MWATLRNWCRILVLSAFGPKLWRVHDALDTDSFWQSPADRAHSPDIQFTRAEGAGMRLRYNRKQDILTLELSEAPIDHAEEVGPIITHFSTDDRLVLL